MCLQVTNGAQALEPAVVLATAVAPAQNPVPVAVARQIQAIPVTQNQVSMWQYRNIPPILSWVVFMVRYCHGGA